MTAHATAARRWLATLLLAGAGPAAWAAGAAHQLDLVIVPAERRLQAVDRITLPATARGELALSLHPSLQVGGVAVDGRPREFKREGATLRVVLPAVGARVLELRYGGRFDASEPPRIAPEGSWLPGEAHWFPQLREDDTLTASIHTPPEQQVALTGERLRESVDASGTRAVYRAYPGEPATLFAGPWQCQARRLGRLKLRACFEAQAAQDLAPGYLADVAQHIDRYAARIGAYPYAGFEVVTGPDPVGLGYPGLTYLSRDIVRLPFMRERSLPHEVLHAWWGNGVRVREGSGNWAEGLTTYLADHGLADEAGRERMRREWLRDWTALPPGSDFALSRFVTKAHARDQVVGYGKAAFVFHMLAQRVGPGAFDAALRRFWAAHRGGQAGWDDWRAAFEAASGESLKAFFTQWIEQPGAPRLSLGNVAWRDDGVQLTLAQQGGPWELRVPIAVDTSAGRERHVVVLDGAQRTVTLATRGRPLALQADPDAALFRYLAPGERAPMLRDLLLQGAVQVVFTGVPEGAWESARRLSSRLLAGSAGQPAPPTAWDRNRPALLVHVGTPASAGTALGLARTPAVNGEDSAVAWAVPDAAAPTVVVAARDAAALEALSRPLPHYGSESWLRFQGARLRERGTWPPAADNALAARRP